MFIPNNDNNYCFYQRYANFTVTETEMRLD